MISIEDKLKEYRIIEQKEDVFFNDEMTRVNRLFGLKDLLDFYKIDKKCVVCEVGSYAGISGELLAMYGKVVYCCDIWEEYITPIERALLVKEHFDLVKNRNGNILEIKKTSYEASKQFKNKSLDMVYIDADHSYESVKNDITYWMPKVKDGGVISGHDYCMDGVKIAVDEMFNLCDIKIFDDSSWGVKIL